MEEAKEIIKRLCLERGFNLCRFASPEPLDGDYFKWWLEQGFNGGMGYLGRNIEKRLHPYALFPWVKTILVVAAAYPLQDYAHSDRLKLSSYIVYPDYHRVMKGALMDVFEGIKRMFPGTQGRVFVDTAPVMEKALAVRCGIGWYGKNTLVVNRAMGSLFFLGEVYLSLEIEPDGPIGDGCLGCTRCMDACPTGALFQEYMLDARRCISYLTIEEKSLISREWRGKTDGWVLGCDACQIVCPYNKDGVEYGIFKEPILKAHHLKTRDGILNGLKGTPGARLGRRKLMDNLKLV